MKWKMTLYNRDKEIEERRAIGWCREKDSENIKYKFLNYKGEFIYVENSKKNIKNVNWKW